MHTESTGANEGLVRRHAHRVSNRADRIVELFLAGIRQSGVSRATRDRIERLVAPDPQGMVLALADWPARIVADRFERDCLCGALHHGVPSRDLALARVALVEALKSVSRADWSGDLEQAWCWQLDTICDLLAEPIDAPLSHAA